MTTAAEVKAMVRPLLDRHPDLALVGRFLFLKPVHHFARAVIIGHTYSKDQFDPRWVVLHLFQVRTFFSLSWGDRLVNWRSPLPGIWQMSDPDVQLSLIEAIEEQALPKLRAMKTLDDYLQFVSEHMFWNQLYDWPHCKIITDVASGNIESARSICEDKIKHWSTDHPHFDEDDRAENRRLRELCACLAVDDRSGLVRLLHEWEAESVRNLKIAHLWEPTPFPLERQLK